MRNKRFIAGALVVLMVISFAGTVSASFGKRTVELNYRDIKITLNGEEVEPKDSEGKVVEPFIIDGTTYLPVRAVADALGLNVDWDGKTSTVILTEPTYKLVAKEEIFSNSGGKTLIHSGEIFTKGSYIDVGGVEFFYNGEEFEVTNNRSDMVRISVDIVGVKADGSYEWICSPGFGGIDKYQYEKDLAENGWAIEKSTDLVRPGETMETTLFIVDFSDVIEGSPANDIDGDGYYDIVFSIRTVQTEDIFDFSGETIKSDAYQLAAE